MKSESNSRLNFAFVVLILALVVNYAYADSPDPAVKEFKLKEVKESGFNWPAYIEDWVVISKKASIVFAEDRTSKP